MPRGYRLLVIALGLILAAASPSGQRGNTQQGKSGDEIANSLKRVADALDQSNEPKRETSDCAVGRDDRKSDLCAQWKAADAAEQAADAADWTVVIGWVGIALGAITMGAAIAAAFFAKRAADHTNSANVIARTTLRPWLSIRDFKVKTFATPIHMHPVTHEHNPKEQWFQVNHQIEVTVENTGSGPALQVWCFTDVLEGHFPSDLKEEWFEKCRKGSHAFSRNIAPNSIETIKSSAHYHTTMREGARAPPLGVSLIYNAAENAAEQRPPFETSLLYEAGRVASSNGWTGYSMEDLINAGRLDPVHGNAALNCQVVSFFPGRMI